MESGFTYGSTWYLSVIPIIIAAIFQGYNIAKIKKACDHVGEAITSRDDLFFMREAIDTSMVLAIWYMGFFASVLALLGYFVFSRGMSVGLAMNHLFLFGVFSLIPGIIGKIYEKKLKQMPVDSDDPEVEAIFQNWLEQWGKPQMRLKD